MLKNDCDFTVCVMFTVYRSKRKTLDSISFLIKPFCIGIISEWWFWKVFLLQIYKCNYFISLTLIDIWYLIFVALSEWNFFNCKAMVTKSNHQYTHNGILIVNIKVLIETSACTLWERKKYIDNKPFLFFYSSCK